MSLLNWWLVRPGSQPLTCEEATGKCHCLPSLLPKPHSVETTSGILKYSHLGSTMLLPHLNSSWTVLERILCRECLVYLDDLLGSFDEALKFLNQVLGRVVASGLKLHPDVQEG